MLNFKLAARNILPRLFSQNTRLFALKQSSSHPSLLFLCSCNYCHFGLLVFLAANVTRNLIRATATNYMHFLGSHVELEWAAVNGEKRYLTVLPFFHTTRKGTSYAYCTSPKTVIHPKNGATKVGYQITFIC